jgi:cytochrome c biogenesis protein CcdA
MREKIKYILKTFKIITQYIVRVIQKILINILLSILYIFGFGITLLLLLIFNRKFLKRKTFNDISWWENASGYDMDVENIIRQS